MDFLYKLYNNQYFALILFSIIAVLLVLFIIVLIAAMKDAKKSKLEKTTTEENIMNQNVEIPNDNAIEEAPAFTEESKEVELESPQTDITFEEPSNENSMNGLLNEFETPDIDLQSNENDLDALIAKASLNESTNNDENVSLNTEDDIDDDFELPAIKKAEESKEVVDFNFEDNKVTEEPEIIEETKEAPNINLEGTGVLNFSNVETESYEIKK